MNRNKLFSIILLSLLLLSFGTYNINAAPNTSNSSINSFLTKLREIENDYYLIGKTVITNSDKSENEDKLKKDINFYITKVQGIKSNMANYAASIKGNTQESRNIALLQFAADFYERGLEELLMIIDSKNDTDYYNGFEFYYYAKILAEQSIDFVEGQLSNK